MRLLNCIYSLFNCVYHATFNKDLLMSSHSSEIEVEYEQHFSNNSCINSNDPNAINEEAIPFMSKERIIRNFLILNFSYFLFYTGFWGLTNLQSTMNAAEGMGPDSQALIYAASMVSALLLTDIFIEKYGCRMVLVTATSLGLPYLASNSYLKWSFLLCTSALFGLTSGPYNSAFSVYVEEIATRYQKQTNQDMEYILALFFGCCTFFLESTQVLGNAISYIVFSEAKEPRNDSFSLNCGIHFDNNDATNSTIEPPPEHERIVLISIYLVLGIVSVGLLFFFLDPLKNDVKEGSGWQLACHRCLAAVRHLAKPHQLLLIPISIFAGVESAFYSNEFTEAYIACSWGVHHVGFVTICFGVCGAIMSLFVGPLVKCVSQMAVLIFAACCNVTICVLLFLWLPSPDTISIYFIIAGIWGMSDAIWWSQITALYGLMFPNDREAAFSNLYFWSFLGFFISYSYANYLNVAVKINILLIFLLTGIIGYLIGQIKIRCAVRREYVNIEE